MSYVPPPPINTTPTTGASAVPGSRAARRAAERADKARRQQLRDQLTSQQTFWKLQRERRSVAGPVLLVVAGFALLRIETGHLLWPSLAAWLVSWWPAVLVGVGLLMCTEWLVDKLRSGGSTTQPRRMLGGPTRLSLVLLAIAGIGSSLVRQNRFVLPNDLGFSDNLRNWDGLQQLFGNEVTLNGSLTAPLAPTGELTLEVPRGKLSVIGSSDDGQVHVILHGTVFTWQKEHTEQLQALEQPRLRGTRDHLLLTTPASGSDDATVQVTVPHGASVVVHGGEGDVSVEELRGTTTVTGLRGALHLTALSGPVHLQLGSQDADVTAHSLDHGLQLEGQSGDLDLSDISGPLDLHGDFFGTTQLQRIHGTVKFQSTYTHFECASLPGSLVIAGRSDLTGNQLTGPMTLATSDRDLVLKSVSGPASVSNRNGSVEVSLSDPASPLRVVDESGSITVTVPDHASFKLQAQARGGDITTPFALPVHAANGVKLVEGAVGHNGPFLDLQTTDEDIRIQRSGDSTSSESPASAGSSDRHSSRTHSKGNTSEPDDNND